MSAYVTSGLVRDGRGECLAGSAHVTPLQCLERVRRAARALLLFVLVPLSACAPDLREAYPFDGATTGGGSRVTHEELGEGVWRTTVDASVNEAWVYLDLDARRELPVDEALTTQDWDLAFQRFKIISNGGVSGPGGVAAAALTGTSFEALTRAPESGFQADETDGTDENSDLDSAFLKGEGWYYYDLGKHRLTARETVYVVRTTDGGYFKLKLLGYYDGSGNSGHVSFEWASVTAP